MSPETPLSAQLTRWQAAGLLSEAQARAIAEFEARAAGEAARATANGRRLSAAATLSIIGALVLGLGLIALVAANWGTLPQTIKFAGLVLLTLTSYGVGYALRDKPGASWPGTGAALYLQAGGVGPIDLAVNRPQRQHHPAKLVGRLANGIDRPARAKRCRRTDAGAVADRW